MTQQKTDGGLVAGSDEDRPPPSTVYDRLREDILSLGLTPGSDLDEKLLAARYGVSRTPIREALIRLAQSGLVEFSPARGARVSALILSGVARYIEAVDLIQRALAHTGALRRLPNDLDDLSAALAEFRRVVRTIDHLDYQNVIRIADAEADVLHALADCAHNSYLRDAYDKLLIQGQRMLRLPFAYNPKGLGSVEEYAADRVATISRAAEAIQSGDAKTAESELRVFHRSLTTRLSAYMAENLTSEVAVAPDEAGGSTDRLNQGGNP
jgi:DNA-binding GntR family transcriptional regulator